MGSVEKVSELLTLWEKQNEENKENEITSTLIKLAELFEAENEAYLKQDPDPFDDRHPSRTQPDCTLGHMLKTIFKNEKIVDQMIKIYAFRDNLELNTAVCRLLLDILPGLENVIFQEEGFVPQLLSWAEHAPNPLQSYATGLLAVAMDVQDIASNFRESNAYFVPLMLKRLRELSTHYLIKQKVSERPFAHLNNESQAPFYEDASPKKNKQSCSTPHIQNKYSKSRFNSSDHISLKKQAEIPNPKISPEYKNPLNEGSNSNWSELEPFVIGSSQIYPLTPAAQQRYILQYLTPMGEYQDLIGYVFEASALSLIMSYIDLHQNPDVKLAFEALKYLASLLCHKKIANEFVNLGGIQLLLKVPRPSMAATGVSICLYYLAYIEEAMERICLLDENIISDLVRYGLWLLECSHDSSRCHATIFFGFSFSYRILLRQFDKQDGLRKLFNGMSTLDIFVLDDIRMLTDDQIFSNRQTTRHVCGSLKRYFEAHLIIEAQRHSFTSDQIRPKDRRYKVIYPTNESVQQSIECLLGSSLVPLIHWKPVDDFLHLDGVSFLLGLIATYFELNYSARAETVKMALDVLKICALTSRTLLIFCEKVSNSGQNNISGIITGIGVLFQAAEGEDLPEPDVQRSALQTIINCVCAKYLLNENFSNRNTCFTPNRKTIPTPQDLFIKIWKCIRISNGIMVLINLISVKTPITDADSLRALACKVLCGLARLSTVKQIISKLPLISNGKLLALIREPILQDKGQEHIKFCKYGLELIERVTGTPVSTTNSESLLNINKAEVVAKTKVIYNERQLIELIAEHLQRHGFTETVACLHKEMNKMLKDTNASLSNFSKSRICSKFTFRSPHTDHNIHKNAHNSNELSNGSPNPCNINSPSIPPPSVPLKLVVVKKQKTQAVKSATKRLQKPQTFSGGYLQSPAMRRQNVLPYKNSSHSITLDSIVTEYLRKQHALCKNPMLACPPFDLFVPHKCPEPHFKRNAPLNYTVRLQKREVSFLGGGYGSARLNNKLIYSKFRKCRTFRDPEGLNDFTCCSFAHSKDTGSPWILIGRLSGEVKAFNIYSGEEEISHNCMPHAVANIETRKFCSSIITSDERRRGSSSLWNFNRNFELLNTFNEIKHMEFGKQTAERLIGTKSDAAVIFDTTSFKELQSFTTDVLGNSYGVNYATFDYNDELVLSDGLIFDVRSNRLIHRLDKFNADHNGVFHPNANEIISNSEIWDIRTFKLLRTVAALDKCQVTFNPSGDIIYGVCSNHDAKMVNEKVNSFFTLDALDYSSIATINRKRPVYQLTADLYDRYIATLEKQTSNADHGFFAHVTGVDCVVRLYEVGTCKGEGDQDVDESEESEESEDDDDDNELSIEEHVNVSNDTEDDDDDDGNDSWILTSDSDDDTLFSLNASQDD